LIELARASNLGFQIDEANTPVNESVRAACELLGLDPYYVANEGKLVAIVSPDAAEPLLQAMRRHPLGENAQIIGTAKPTPPGRVQLHTQIGTSRILDPPTGELLPRIC
jgi:hydrogenase expression/formation protein HypE